MKCPSCGFWNKASFPKCFRCGAPLHEASCAANAKAPADAHNVPILPEPEPLPSDAPIQSDDIRTASQPEATETKNDAPAEAEADPSSELQRAVRRMLSNNRGAYKIEEPLVTTERRGDAPSGEIKVSTEQTSTAQTQTAQASAVISPPAPEPTEHAALAQASQTPPADIEMEDVQEEPATARGAGATVPESSPVAADEHVDAARQKPTPERRSMSYIPPTDDDVTVYTPRSAQAARRDAAPQSPPVSGYQDGAAAPPATPPSMGGVPASPPQAARQQVMPAVSPPAGSDNAAAYAPPQAAQLQPPARPAAPPATGSVPASHPQAAQPSSRPSVPSLAEGEDATARGPQASAHSSAQPVGESGGTEQNTPHARQSMRRQSFQPAATSAQDDDNATVYIPRDPRPAQNESAAVPPPPSRQPSPMSFVHTSGADDAVTQYVPRRQSGGAAATGTAPETHEQDAPAYIPTRKQAVRRADDYIPEPMRQMRRFSDEERERYIESTRREPSWRPPPAAPGTDTAPRRQTVFYRDAEPPQARTSRRAVASRREPDPPAAARRGREPQMYLGASGRGPAKTVVTLLIWVLILGALAFGAYQGIMWVGGKTGLLQGSGEPSEAQAVVEAQEIEGKPGHIITFRGGEEEQIYIPQLKNSFPIMDGVAKVLIKDEIWITPDTETETVQAELTPTLYSAAGKATELTPITYTVNVPLSPLTFVSPDAASGTETNSSLYTLKVQVLPGSTVTITDRDISDFVDREGSLTYNLPIEPIGNNTFDITVKMSGYRINRQTLTIYRTKMEIPLEIDNSVPETSTIKTMQVTGKTDPGATLTVETPIKGDMPTPDSDGSFSFTASFDRYGSNEVRIRAAMPGKQDSVILHNVNYTPNVDEYTKGAWKMDYEGLRSNNTAWKGKVFVCAGTVKEIISTEPYMFYMDIGGGKQVVIEMVPEKIPVQGSKYRVYADLDGMHEDEPKLIGRYFFND